MNKENHIKPQKENRMIKLFTLTICCLTITSAEMTENQLKGTWNLQALSPSQPFIFDNKVSYELKIILNKNHEIEYPNTQKTSMFKQNNYKTFWKLNNEGNLQIAKMNKNIFGTESENQVKWTTLTINKKTSHNCYPIQESNYKFLMCKE